MNIQRGDVLKARLPHASGERGKKRPVVVVQADSYNRRLRHAVVAEVTGNLEGNGDPACRFADSVPHFRLAIPPVTRGPDLLRLGRTPKTDFSVAGTGDQ